MVRERYFAYYRSFIGCGFQTGPRCRGMSEAPASYTPGNPQSLAERQANGYVSAVADNIVQAISTGFTLSETRYTIDPTSASFDRVTAQRHGSSQANQDGTLVPPDDPTDNWQTKLPKTTLSYQSAGPASDPAGDLTDAFLPAEIRERYPLEQVPSCPPLSDLGQLMGCSSWWTGLDLRPATTT